MLKTIKYRVLCLWRTADEVAREKAVDIVSHEIAELENIFALLVMGMFVGIPSPPIQITLALIPDMVDEFDLMLSKVATAHDPLGELFSVLDID